MPLETFLALFCYFAPRSVWTLQTSDDDNMKAIRTYPSLQCPICYVASCLGMNPTNERINAFMFEDELGLSDADTNAILNGADENFFMMWPDRAKSTRKVMAKACNIPE